MEARTFRRVFVTALIAVAALALSVGVAFADVPYNSADCQACHDKTTGAGAMTKVDFKVPAVNFNSCYKCHWISPTDYAAGSSFTHSHNGPGGCRSCHANTFYFADGNRLPSVATAYGYFNKSTSTSTSPETIHDLHMNGSWPKIGLQSPNFCGSCHMPAGCDSCHSGEDMPTHNEHTKNKTTNVWGYEPVSYTVAGGTAVRPMFPFPTAYTATLSCVNAACHDPNGTIGATSKPDCVSCHNAKTVAHGAESVNHTASQTTTVETSIPASAAWTTVTAAGKQCGACHKMPVVEEHARTSSSTSAAGCAACHNPARNAPGDLEASHTLVPAGWAQPGGTAKCSTAYCHVTSGATEKHKNYSGSHTSTQTSCATAGCHVADLVTLHQNATASVAATIGWSGGTLAKSCNVCHRTDRAATSTDCQGCHAGHGDLVAIHTANPTSPTLNPSSQCIQCHEAGGDVRTIHQARGCAVCHSNPSRIPNIALKAAECATCHDKPTDTLSPKDYFPYDPNHYTGTESTHTATESGTDGGKTCNQCHYLEMKPEHVRVTNNPQWTCVQCHETNVDSWNGTAWDKRCSACHNATNAPAAHSTKAASHVSTSTACSGAGCHDLTDVSLIHGVPGSEATSNVAGIGLVTSCNVCHYNRDQIFGPTDGSRRTTNCQTCHSTINVATHGKHALNRVSSDASITAVTGCTNSGLGCHGSDTTTTPNYQTPYHNASGCATGPCHTSASKSLKTPPISCQGCHDGTYLNASHVDNLTTQTAGGGHYAEATHTAGSMNATVTGFAGGTITAACSNCHANTGGTGLKQLYKQHQNLPAPYTNTTCFDCHNYNASVAAIVTSSWPTKACDACHNASAMPTAVEHAQVAPSVIGTSPLTCVTTGCHTTWNLHELHKGDASTGATLTAGGCAVTGCHNYGAQAAKPTQKSCGQGSAGCHLTFNTVNHGGTHDLSYATSIYNNTTVTGCLDAGAGCHVTTSTINYQPYHPASGCTTGPCHTSASKATHINPLTCQACHDKSYVGAAGVATLTALAGTPGGHYSETSHTAVTTNTTGLVTSGGTASASCSNCHNNAPVTGLKQLYAQHQNLPAPYANTTCSDCHNRNAAIQAVVTTKWPTKRCDACHNASAMSTMTPHPVVAPAVAATSALSCGSSGTNCHTSTDLHYLHRNAAGGCALSNCHNYSTQATKPTLKGCGAGGSCHTDHTATGHSLITGNESTHTAGATQAGDTAYQATACSSCHSMQLTVEHTRSTSVRSGNYTNTCLNCHNNPASTTAITGSWATNRNATTACAQCHDGTGLNTRHADASATAHTVANTGCGGTGAGCHPTSNISQSGVPTTTANIHSSCLRCHDIAGAASWTSVLMTTPANVTYNPTVKSCGQATGCHTSAYYNPAAGATQYQHRIGLADVVTGDDTAHHETSSGAMASVISSGAANPICSDCHIGTLKSEHATTSLGTAVGCASGGSAGAGCHNSTATVAPTSASVVKSSWPTRTCAACHTNQHNSIGTVHTGTSTAGCANSGAGCHNTANLVDLHKNKVGGQGCEVANCHSVANRSLRPTMKSCGTGGSCHSTYSGSSHGAINGDDTTHTASAALLSAQVATGTFSVNSTCDKCHSVTLKSSHTTVTTALGSGNPAWTQPLCSNCHNTTTPVNAVSVVKTTGWATHSCTQCHTAAKHSANTTATHTAAVGSVGAGAAGCASAGCHGSTDVRVVHNNYVTRGCTAKGNDSFGANPGCHDLDKQMTAGTIGCGQGSGAATQCHASHTDSNHMPSHDVTDTVSLTCLNCHEAGLTQSIPTTSAISIHSTLTAGTTVSGKPNDGCIICHGGSGWTDVAATAKANGTALRCAGCHNGTLVGTHPYNPITSHYDAPVAKQSHYATAAIASTETTTRPDRHGVSRSASYGCTSCHSTYLGAEHTKTSSSFAATTTADGKCVVCHESKVDNFTTYTYDGGCTGDSSPGSGTACHATRHSSATPKHDASAVLISNPGTVTQITTAAVTPLNESFATNTWPAAFVRGSTTYVTLVNTAGQVRSTYALKIFADSTTRRTFNAYVDVDLSTLETATLSYWRNVSTLAGGTDYATVDYSTNGGTSWTVVENRTAASTWSQVTTGVPVGGVVRLRFSGSFNATTEYANWDDILITGVSSTASTVALPANSRADVSCMNAPNGTECHDVSDVAEIHISAPNKCATCHTGNTVIASTLNCQDAACHGTAKNNWAHRTLYHESQIASGATGQVFAGTGFTNLWCTGCHDNSIDDEHNVLTRYKSTPCSVCHNKVSNSTNPTVTSADTSVAIHADGNANTELCTDCHKTVSAASVHSRRTGTTSVLGSVQFDSTWSGHRVYSSIFGSRTGGTTQTFNGQATSITWPLPSNTTWLKSVAVGGAAAAQLTPTSMLWCTDCHGSVVGATGPHGASMSVKYAAGYDNSYSNGTLTYTSGNAMSNTTNICAKCHTTTAMGYNNVHSRTGDHAVACTYCHVKIPHAWKRPRLIGYTTDPAPYASTVVTGIAQKSYTLTGWAKADCGALSPCNTHSQPGTLWP